MPRLVLAYAKCACAYGALHSVLNLLDRQGAYRDSASRSDRQHQLLLSDKLAIGAGLTLAGIAYWPVMLHHDLTRAELALRRPAGINYDPPHFLLG